MDQDRASDSDRWERALAAAEVAEDGTADGTARARAHIVVRVVRMSVAVLLLLAGAAMLVLPGPGWLVVAAGFALLARDVAWAERWVLAIKRRVPGARDDGTLPRGTWLTIVVASLAAAAAGLWFVLR
jgi:hypothetical protein